jgi:UDP-N-acetylglucosamine:LPS N-acetylglucosamine transferase
MVENPQLLVDTIKDLLLNHKESEKMAHKFANFARPNAARDVAEMIISSSK